MDGLAACFWDDDDIYAAAIYDEIETVQGWWEVEERCFDEFIACQVIWKDDMADSHIREELDMWYDDWKHCEGVLEAVSSMVRGW
jgi:hypothetical protein